MLDVNRLMQPLGFCQMVHSKATNGETFKQHGNGLLWRTEKLQADGEAEIVYLSKAHRALVQRLHYAGGESFVVVCAHLKAGEYSVLTNLESSILGMCPQV